MTKSKCLNFGVQFSKDNPNCPYLGSPCNKFNFDLGRSVCCKGESRCSWLPYWVASVSNCVYAILKDGRLVV